MTSQFKPIPKLFESLVIEITVSDFNSAIIVLKTQTQASGEKWAF